jgi:hypothetical protein
MMNKLIQTSGAAVSLLAGVAFASAREPSEPADQRYALLIGCTKYDKLAEKYQLEGPANDVPLMEKLLTERYRFPRENIVKLVEGSDAGHRPTYANIMREILALAGRARPGSRVVIHFSGHGSQEPDQDPPEPDDPEPDGRDEILLPADFEARWDSQARKFVNAIVDDELRAWLAKFADGVRLWVIVDACNSGSATRAGDETARIVPYDDLETSIPPDVLKRSEERAADAPKSRGGSGEPREEVPARLVATYAALPTEPTIELKLPPRQEVRNDGDRQWHGLMTFAICRVLTNAGSPLSYRELIQRVNVQYSSWGKDAPTPLVEGLAQSDEVLGDKVLGRRPPILLRKRGLEMTVNAGTLQGLTGGTILGVYPPPGAAKPDELQGYVQIEEGSVGILASPVAPVAFAGRQAPELAALPDGARCQVAQVDVGELALHVTVQAIPPKESTRDDAEFRRAAAEVDRLRETLKPLAAQAASPYRLVEMPSQAGWVIEVGSDRTTLIPKADLDLLAAIKPGKGRTPDGESSFKPRRFGPVPPGEMSGPWLDQRLRQIARVENLIKVTGNLQNNTLGAPGGPLDVKVELLWHRDQNDFTGSPVKWSPDLKMHGGDRISFRVLNQGDHSVDVTILFIDSGYGVNPYLPAPNEVLNNRISPTKPLKGLRKRLGTATLGKERIVVLVTQAKGEPRDFTIFVQPTLERARSVDVTRGETTLATPLGQVLSRALYRMEGTRSLGDDDIEAITGRVLSWETTDEPRTKPPELIEGRP